MKFHPLIAPAGALLLSLGACRTAAPAAEPAAETAVEETAPPTRHSEPRARVFRASGDWRGHVPVRLSPDGRSVVWRPEPAVVDASSAPREVADGYCFDPWGLDGHTAFTSYTFEEYGALAEAPSDARLLQSLIPGAVVTEIIELPIGRRAAEARPALAAEALKSPEKTVIFKR